MAGESVQAIEARKHIEKYKEYTKRREKLEVIVSYDCSDIHEPFYDRLLNYIKNNRRGSQITKSLYRLPTLLNADEQYTLAKDIRDLFDACVLNESAKIKRTIVCLLTPNGNQIDSHIIIDEGEEF